jgi:hypothetical protein
MPISHNDRRRHVVSSSLVTDSGFTSVHLGLELPSARLRVCKVVDREAGLAILQMCRGIFIIARDQGTRSIRPQSTLLCAGLAKLEAYL